MARTATPAATAAASTALVLVGTRLHRPTCPRPSVRAGDAADTITDRDTLTHLRDAVPATCCKPNALVVDATRGGAAFRIAALDTADATPAVEPVADPCTDDAAIPAVGLVSVGTGELAGGDVQTLPREGKPRTRRPNRHDQIGVTPRGAQAHAEAAQIVAAAVAGQQVCTGTCAQALPVVKFPTTSKGGRGTECRTCRDARRAAAKA